MQRRSKPKSASVLADIAVAIPGAIGRRLGIKPRDQGDWEMTVAELAYEQIKTLPETQSREVLDFICYLKEKSERNGMI
jgi:hypothetical protein